MKNSRIKQLIELARKKGLIRPRDLVEIAIPRQYLSIACKRGELVRVGRGLYSLPGKMFSEHRSLAEVCTRIPSGNICLLSALQFHELTSQMPYEVWIAIDEKARKPKIEIVQVRFVRFSGSALTEGIESYKIEGAEIRVYNPAKTVADCFKYRNKIGLDVAIEALKDTLHQKKATVDELVHFSRICRVERIMSPYIEAVL